MSSARGFLSKIPITSTLVLIFGNIELYRVHKGIHPYWTPKLEATGYVPGENKTSSSGSTEKRVKSAKVDDGDNTSETSIRWANLNGVPIPTLEALVRPFR